MKTIVISSNRGTFEVLVSEEDYQRVSEKSWRINFSKANRPKPYLVAETTVWDKQAKKRKNIKMHRFILGLTDPKINVDHIDGNPLNNTRENLRTCSNQQNRFNRSKQSNNTSGFKGVTKNKNRWVAQIFLNRKRIYLGSYATPEEASKVYEENSLKYHGKFAKA